VNVEDEGEIIPFRNSADFPLVNIILIINGKFYI
jgi:hypothetical protein